MTSLQIYTREDAAHVLTDGLLMGPEGEITGLSQKVRILAHCNAVVTGRGPTEIKEYFADRANWAFTSFDEAVAGMAETCEICVAMFRAQWPDARYEPNLITLIGWSEKRSRPEAWVTGSDIAGGKARQIANFCAPTSPALVEAMRAGNLLATHPGFDPARDGLEILRLQRDALFKHPATGKEGRAVGGFAQHTVITAEGISTRILERWDDAA